MRKKEGKKSAKFHANFKDMNLSFTKEALANKKKIVGTSSRPRLSVRFTNKNIHAQCINDDSSTTIVSVSANEKDLNSILPNLSGSEKVGTVFEENQGSRNKYGCFDRAGEKYGCVKAFQFCP